jgi:flavodoxin
VSFGLSSSQGSKNTKCGIVIYDSRYGNTKKIAESIERGLLRSGIESACVDTKEAKPDSLKNYDLIAVGAPTEMFTASKPMKEFLDALKVIDLSGKYGFAFETKIGRALTGSAAKHIEKKLSKRGVQLIAPRESAIVFGTSSSMDSMTLKAGEEARFEELGFKLGQVILGAKPLMTT